MSYHHQRMGLRCNLGGTMLFATDEGLRAYEDECIAARARQLVPFAVAPRVYLSTPRGLLKAGDEVRLTDLQWSELQDAVATGRVLEAEGGSQTHAPV